LDLQTGAYLATKVHGDAARARAERLLLWWLGGQRGRRPAAWAVCFAGFVAFLGLLTILSGYGTVGAYVMLGGTALMVLAALWQLVRRAWGLASVGGAGTLLALGVFLGVGTREIIRQDSEEQVVVLADLGIPKQDEGSIVEASPNPFIAPAATVPQATSEVERGSGDDFFVNERPKIAIVPRGDALVYRHLRPRAGDDPVAFYRPALRRPERAVRLAGIDLLRRLPAQWRREAAGAVGELAHDPDTLVRVAAVASQAWSRDSASVGNAIGALDDEHPVVRAVAVRALAVLQDPAAIGPLADRLTRLGHAAVEALAAYGAEHSPAIAKALLPHVNDGDAKLRLAVIGEIVKRDPALAMPVLVTMLRDEDEAVRAFAFGQCAGIRQAGAIEAMAARLGADPLAEQNPPRFGESAEKAVAGRLGDPDVRVRLAAINVLKEIGTGASLEAVRRAAADSDGAVARTAREVWRKVAPNELSPLDEVMMDLASNDAARRKRALTALAGIEPDANHPALPRTLFDTAMAVAGDKGLGETAERALARWANADARTALLHVMNNVGEAAARRRTAIRVLSAVHEPRALEPLCRLLGDEKVAFDAAEALRAYGVTAEGPLIRMLGEVPLSPPPVRLGSDRQLNLEALRAYAVQRETVGRAMDVLIEIGGEKSQRALGSLAIQSSDPTLKERARAGAAAIREKLERK
jgi:HEAT repeat protein